MPDDVTLINGDCLDLMGRIESGSVDLILADLPYGTTACKWDTVIPFEPLWAHYKRVIKSRGAIVLTASQPFTSALVMSNPAWFRCAWVWEKTKASGHLHAKRYPLRAHEDVLVFARGVPRYCPQGLRFGQFNNSRPCLANKPDDLYRPGRRKPHAVSSAAGYPRTVLKVANPSGTGHAHSTQKPVALMEYLIRTYTNAGELVLDNTMGSGTTGVACLNTGRRFIGIEKDPGIFATAQDRIAKAQAAKAELLIA